MSALPAPTLKKLRPLPPRLRLAHLRALLRQELPGSKRGPRLTALLREQLAGHEKADRAI